VLDIDPRAVDDNVMMWDVASSRETGNERSG
jgi:hypothetical protein